MDQAVEKAVPNFREINLTPGRHQFLRAPDPLSGQISKPS